MPLCWDTRVEAIRARWRTSPRLRDGLTAATTFVVGAGLDLLGFTGAVPGASASAAGWFLIPLAIGCLAMLIKRRHPVVALGIGVLVVAADVALGGSLAMVLVVFDILFGIGESASPRVRRGVMTGVTVVIGTSTIVTGLATRDAQATVGILLNLGGLLVLPLWWAGNVRQQRELGQLQAEQARRDAVDSERSAMARELHDVVAAHLSTTAIHSGAVLALPPETGRDREALRAVRASSLAALEEMRMMITVLRRGGSDAQVPAGLAQLPQALQLARAGGLEVTEDVRPVPLTSTVDQAAYRIVAEALTNARKHAPGSRVRVSVAPEGETFTVTITNTLVGARTVDHSGLSAGTGLVSMRERAALVGGSLWAGRDGDVWRVQARLPLAVSP